MSEQEREGIYVYQPYGTAAYQSPLGPDRLWGLGGLPAGVECKGLTEEEAHAFADALNDITWMTDECARCGHRLRFMSDGCPQCSAKADPPWVPRGKSTTPCECARCVRTQRPG
jgi:hypothetical protein